MGITDRLAAIPLLRSIGSAPGSGSQATVRPPSGPSVLIPTGKEMKSYGCMRALGRRGIHTIVASDEEWIPHFASKYCSERGQLPSYRHDLTGYKDALLDIASRPDVETIIPVRECDAYVLAKYGPEFDAHVSVVSPTLETLRRGHDRLQLAREAAEAGVPYAETSTLSSVDEWDRDVVVKSRYNILTDEYVDGFPSDRAREEGLVLFLRAGEEPDPDAIRERMGHEPIVQEFVPEAEKYLYCGLWHHGEPIASYQHEQLRKVSWMGGGGVYRRSAYSEEVAECAEALLSHLDWHGYACIEYLRDADTGEWKFLELNPRVWLSMPEAIRNGVDFPYYYWRCAQGETRPVDVEYETGYRCHVSYGELKHLLSVRRDVSPFAEPPPFGLTLLSIGYSCLRYPRFDYLRRDDPRFVISAIRTLSGLSADGLYRAEG